MHIEMYANKHMPSSFVDEWIPKDNDKFMIKLKANKEKELLSTWIFWNNNRLKVVLVVSRCKDNRSKHKKKFEKFGEFDYYGPFTLFSKLKEYHEGTFRFLESKHFNFSSAMRISGLLHDVNVSESNYRLLQFSVLALFNELHDLFWNLIFWFSKQKRDYLFILPYEIDLENQSDYEESWDRSEHNLTPRSNGSGEDSPHQKNKEPTKINHDFGDAIGKMLSVYILDEAHNVRLGSEYRANFNFGNNLDNILKAKLKSKKTEKNRKSF